MAKREVALLQIACCFSLLALAGCRERSEIGGLEMRLIDPEGVLDDSAVLSLSVYDENAACRGSQLELGGGQPIEGLARTFAPSESVMLKVPPGARTFSLTAFGDGAQTVQVGRGCTRQTLAPGETARVDIYLASLVGMRDMGADLATPSDLATPDDAQPDLVAPADLATAPDLALPPDLASPPDLALPDLATADLAISADLATPADLAMSADVAMLPPPPDLAGADFASLLPGDRCPGLPLPQMVPTTGTNKGYSDDGAGSCAPGMFPDQIFNITLAARSRVVIDLQAASANQTVFIVGGSCPIGGGAVEKGCAKGMNLATHLDLIDLAAGSYWIYVDGSGGPSDFTITWQALPPVVPGSCGQPTPLTEGTPRIGDTNAGLLDNAFPTCSGNGADHVYSFTLAAPRKVVIDLSNGTFASALYVHATTCNGKEAGCVAGNGTESLTLPNLAAGTYYVFVDGQNGASGSYDIVYHTFAPPPPYDNCGLIAMNLQPGVPQMDTLADNAADDGKGSCGGAGGADKVYEIDLAQNQRLQIAASGGFPYVAYLRGGPTLAACGDPTTELGCKASDANGNAALDLLNLPAGKYFIWIDAQGQMRGSFTVTATLAPPVLPPANDFCNAAIQLTDGVTVANQTTLGTGSETAGSCNPEPPAAGDAYYFFDTTLFGKRDASVTVKTAGFSAAAFLQTTCGVMATEVKCTASMTPTTVLSVAALPPGKYFVVVEPLGGGNGGGFSITLNLTLPVAPANDNCGAPAMVMPGVAVPGTTINGSDDFTATCGGMGNADVVYSFTVPQGMPSRVKATVTPQMGSPLDPLLSIRSACAVAASEVPGGCANATQGPGTTEVLDLPNLAPGTYYLIVDGADVAQGGFTVKVDLLPPVLPPGDVCSMPIALTPNQTLMGNTAGATDDYTPSCQMASGPDLVYAFTLASPAAVLLTLNAIYDARFYLRAANLCTMTNDLSCTLYPYINKPTLPAGSYDVIVDGANGAAGAFSLNLQTAAADASFGYWKLSTPQGFQSIAAAQNDLALVGGAQSGTEFKDVTLPFSFDFYGVVRTAARVNHKGYLSFDTTAPVAANVCIPNAANPNNMIAPFWDDLYSVPAAMPLPQSHLYYATRGSAPNRQAVFEWNAYAFLNAKQNQISGQINAQAILYESGDIEFQYGPGITTAFTMPDCGRSDGCSATVGLESPGGTQGKQIECNMAAALPAAGSGPGTYFVHPR